MPLVRAAPYRIEYALLGEAVQRAPGEPCLAEAAVAGAALAYRDLGYDSFWA